MVGVGESKITNHLSTDSTLSPSYTPTWGQSWSRCSPEMCLISMSQGSYLCACLILRIFVFIITCFGDLWTQHLHIFQVDPPDGEGPRNSFCSSPRNHGYHVQTLVSGGHDVVDVWGHHGNHVHFILLTISWSQLNPEYISVEPKLFSSYLPNVLPQVVACLYACRFYASYLQYSAPEETNICFFSRWLRRIWLLKWKPTDCFRQHSEPRFARFKIY